MTAHVEAFKMSVREHIEPTLVCRCGAMNRPGATYIHIEENGEAHCDSCARHGKIRYFQREA